MRSSARADRCDADVLYRDAINEVPETIRRRVEDHGLGLVAFVGTNGQPPSLATLARAIPQNRRAAHPRDPSRAPSFARRWHATTKGSTITFVLEKIHESPFNDSRHRMLLFADHLAPVIVNNGSYDPMRKTYTFR